MEERNPLDVHTSLAPSKRPQQSNKRGRPSSAKAVKFSSQPKSIISQLLNKVQEYNCDSFKDEIKTSEVKNDVPNRTTNLESDDHQIKSNFEPEINSYEDLQESHTSDLTSVEVGPDSFMDSYLLHDKELNIYQSTQCDKKNSSAVKLFPIACYVCSHRSSSQKAHRQHLSIHRNQPYKCNFPNCSYSCKLSSNLIKHKRIHTSEKSYLCDQCTFRTNFGNSLKVHKRIHTSERPYGCQYCSYQCNSSSNLKKHCLHRHKDVS